MVLCFMFGRYSTFADGKLNAKKLNLKHKTMNKFKKTVLMLCLILSGALCYAGGVVGTRNEKGEGNPIEVFEVSILSGLNRGHTIVPVINGHVLTVEFNANLGQVAVEVATAAGASVHCLSVLTPNGLQVYIPNAGNYIVTFTLPNGDEYYGEFTVSD